MTTPVPIDAVRVHFDFAAPDVVEEIRRLASLGHTDREVAWHFGLRGAQALLEQLARPEHAVALQALRAPRVAKISEALERAWKIAGDYGHRSQLRALVWLVERMSPEAKAELEQRPPAPGTDARAPQTPEEIRVRLRTVRDAQRGVLQ